MIRGAETRPSTVTIAVTSSDWVSATKWICGSRLPTSCSEPSSKSMRWPSTSSRPRRRSNWPTGWMSVVVPWIRSAPPSSTSRPRPRTKIWFGALIRMSRPMPGPAGPGAARGVPIRARSSVTCTGARRGDVGHLLERGLRGAEALGDRDLGAAEVDGAGEQAAAADQRPGHRQRAVEPGADELPVGVAHVVDPGAEVGRVAARAVERDPALAGDRAAGRDRGAEAADRGDVAVEARLEADVVQPDVGSG